MVKPSIVLNFQFGSHISAFLYILMLIILIQCKYSIILKNTVEYKGEFNMWSKNMEIKW